MGSTMPRTAIFVALTASMLFAASPATSQADSEERLADDLIHSDLPLFGSGTEHMWPQAFVTEDSFGCTSRVIFGNWIFRETGGGDDEDAEWYRVTNYGVYHCFANVAHAYRKQDLERTDSRPSFFVLLGTMGETELWAIQIGARPGSDYVLLSRQRGGEGGVKSFNVLQRQCPRGRMREGASVSILLTQYCAINTQVELLHLARRMAALRPLGTLVLVEKDTGDE